jgi:hypothetical protein
VKVPSPSSFARFFFALRETMNLWNIKKTSEYLDRSEGAVRNLVLRRKIPFRKVGGRLMFIEDEISRWADGSPGVKLADCLRRDQ